MKYHKIALCISGSLCFMLNARSQQLMTLDNAIAIGLKNNYDILMAKNLEAVTANDYHYAFGAFLPVIDGSASRTWSKTDISQKYSDGRKTDRNNTKSSNTNASVDLNWTLFDGLRVFATRDKLEAIRNAGELTVKNQVVNTVADIITTYYNVVQQKEQLQSIAEQMSISQERVKIAHAKFQSGLSSKIDQLQAQVDLNAQKAAYLRQQVSIEESKAQLNQLIALPTGNEYTVSDTIPVNLGLQLAPIKQQAFQNNPALQLAQTNIDISKLSLKEIQRSRLPTISFNSSYSFNKQNSGAGFFLFNQSKGLDYGFSASIPIFEGFNTNRLAKNAQLDIQYQQLALENQRSQVDLALENAFKEYGYAKEALQLEEDNLGIARENVQVALAAFRQGQTSTLEVKVAQDGLANAMYRLISARYNVKVAETNLLKLRGDILQ